MIAKLLHIANSSPPGPKVEREQFYEMKSRILHRFGKVDGGDTQHLPGKICFGCDGRGTSYWDRDECYRCGGSGWWKSPRIVTLRRWKLGRFVFHEPLLYRVPKKGETFTFEGFVKHAVYAERSVRWATLVLGLIFDWRVARAEIADVVDGLWIGRAWTRRCQYCKRRLWSTRRWQCKSDCMSSTLRKIVDEDIPF